MRELKLFVRAVLTVIAIVLFMAAIGFIIYVAVCYVDGTMIFTLPRTLSMLFIAAAGVVGAYGLYSAAQDMRH